MKWLRRVVISRAVVILAAGFAVSCLGSSPAVSLYTMKAASNLPPGSALDGLAIGVGPIHLPRYLDRPEWVTRPSGSVSRLEVDDYRRWAGGFSSNVATVLAENLGAKLGTQRVVVYPVEPGFPLDYRISLDFQAFEGIGGETLELRAGWMIRTGSGERGPWSGHSAIRRPIASGGPDALVAAHNEALDLLADAIAARIKSLPMSDADARGSDAQPPD